MQTVLSSLPRKLILMSACSGSGMLELVMAALADVMNATVLDGESNTFEAATAVSSSYEI